MEAEEEVVGVGSLIKAAQASQIRRGEPEKAS